MEALLKQTEHELKELFAYARAQKINDVDMYALLCKHHLLHQQQHASKNRSRVLLAGITLILLSALIYALSYVEVVAWHLSALGRMGMIQVLPYYDWQVLKHERCLISSKHNPPTELSPSIACYYCESDTEVKFITAPPEWNADMLKMQFLDINRPVMFDYNDYYASDVQLDGGANINRIVTFLQANGDYATHLACDAASNLIESNDNVYIDELLRRTSIHDAYFLHYSNCNTKSVKQFRNLFKRPTFFVDEAAPIQYSWLLLARNYNTSNFKYVALQERYAAVMQVLGRFVYELRPLPACVYECTVYEVALHQGEVLLITDAWELRYRPEEEGDNVAVILETH